MTVEEAIEKLKRLPQHSELYFWDKENEVFVEINNIFLDSDGDVSFSEE